MKNQILIFAFVFFVESLLAQLPVPSAKGDSPIVSNQNSPTFPEGVINNTYAVVIGISDYQDMNIPDLRFADKDAEAFANFLRSNAVGNMDVDTLKV